MGLCYKIESDDQQKSSFRSDHPIPGHSDHELDVKTVTARTLVILDQRRHNLCRFQLSTKLQQQGCQLATADTERGLIWYPSKSSGIQNCYFVSKINLVSIWHPADLGLSDW